MASVETMTASSPASATSASVPPLTSLDPRAPVGIFDSGLGGLSVLRAVRSQLPDEALIYVADSLYAPYGERDDDFIADRTLAIGEWLVAQGAKALVVACNTATAQSIALVREKLPIQLIGVEPGVKPAALQSKSRVAGVLATRVTLRSARFQGLLERYASDCRFLCQPGLGLVEAVERCDIGSPELRALIESYLQPMLDAGADTLVLGCTHYPFLDAAIRDIAGDRLTLIDTSVAIARQLERVLDQQGLRSPARDTVPQPRFCSTSDGAHLKQLAATLLDIDAPVERVHIPSRRTIAPDSHAA
ncbi:MULTISPECIES: glutamate racemase [Paraburkholderia]|jgi:glutamate racemase|uniref:Glutamate racemase n=1 Tax=Paraburkholderia caribensis TaxID=75105 RepID=A0A9Q6S2E8_9BURK|nr:MULTISPECIES: glutamate racemase [Paraburkholderia]ALP62569.1 glutamate racemase [Paraburkholderia caribensis]AUT52204.1 glutamate racemase [Paraburkholderia caribensis]MCO4881406.1 glutamate racemase [Paraburkholderia caribensis]MDR6380332.1 glutamate racemase [Paraburkholderia caribensis]PTB25450.1 glutamate racemase [Paraburkholderia caribensis]